MSREEWLTRYRTDPEFRLSRLLVLRGRNYRKQGGFPSDGAFEADIEAARKEIADALERGLSKKDADQ